MRDELEQKLQEDFPFMKQNREDGECNTYRRWGCECGDGWYNLIHELCEAITKRYDVEQMPVDIVVLQVKEKLGTLRLYYEYEDTPCPIQAFDFLGDGTSVRLTPPDASTDEKKIRLRRDIAEIVRSHEKKSASICEICGDSGGEHRNVSAYYVRTICLKCYNDRIRKVELKNKIEKDIKDYIY